MNEIKLFETGKKYSNNRNTLKVIKRTDKTVWFINMNEPQKLIQKRILISGGINRVELVFFRPKNINDEYFELSSFHEVKEV